MRTFYSEYEMVSHMVRMANVEQLLDGLMNAAHVFPHRNNLTVRFKEVAEKIVAECVAAKLTEPVFPLPKHDDALDLVKIQTALPMILNKNAISPNDFGVIKVDSDL